MCENWCLPKLLWCGNVRCFYSNIFQYIKIIDLHWFEGHQVITLKICSEKDIIAKKIERHLLSEENDAQPSSDIMLEENVPPSHFCHDVFNFAPSSIVVARLLFRDTELNLVDMIWSINVTT